MDDWSPHVTRHDLSGFSDAKYLKKEQRNWRLKVVAICGVIALIAGFSAKPAYHVFRDYRIARNLELAKAAARTEDWGTARDKARSVLLARNNDFEAFRIWARALSKLGEPRTYMAAVQLFADPRATTADRLEALQIMAVQAPQAVALSAYASLSKELRDQASFRAAITPLLVMRGEIGIAEKGLREAATSDDPPKVRLELLRVLCAKPTPERVGEARQIFADLIKQDASEEALAALLILGETPGGLAPGEPLPDLREWVRSQPHAQTLHHLLALHPAIEAQPAAAESLFDAAIARFLIIDPGTLGTWLVRHNRSEQAAKLLTEPAKTSSSAFIARLNALLRLNKTAELAAALANPPDSADIVEMEIVRAALAKRRGDLISSRAAWTKALNNAAFNTSNNRYIDIARAATGFGATESAADAWVAAIRTGWGQLPLYRDLLPVFGLLASKGRSEDLLAIYRTLLRLEPHNAELINNSNYLALIHGLQPPAQVVVAQSKLIADQPDRPEFNSTLMLAEMLDGQPAAALACLPKVRESRGVSSMMKTALEGTARVLAGETAAGTTLLQDVNWRLFIRQERVAFREVLVKLKIAEIPLPELETQVADHDPDQNPAWRNAVEHAEKARAHDTLPALPAPHVPGADIPINNLPPGG